MGDVIAVRLLHPEYHSHLVVQRLPKRFLRFVRKRDGGEWDVLDQLRDTPAADELVIAALFAGKTQLHIDGKRKGRRFAEWWTLATFAPCDPQPSDAELRENDLWRKWCYAQAKLDLQRMTDLVKQVAEGGQA